jgi:hypothetical protein
MDEVRLEAIQAYIKALRTAEESAVLWLGRHLSVTIELRGGLGDVSRGIDAVLDRLRRIAPFTPVYGRGAFADPSRVDDETLEVEATFDVGGAPSRMMLTFTFDPSDQLLLITETLEFAPSQTGTELTPHMRALVNGALAAGTPMVLAYVASDGTPRLSLRGSVQVFGPATLCLWVRPGSRFLAGDENRVPVSLLLRESRTRTTLTFTGSARRPSETESDLIFNLIPEVEQTHDPKRVGRGVLIDVHTVKGTLPNGPVDMVLTQG